MHGPRDKQYDMPAQAFKVLEHCAASLHLRLSGKEQGFSIVAIVSLEGQDDLEGLGGSCSPLVPEHSLAWNAAVLPHDPGIMHVKVWLLGSGMAYNHVRSPTYHARTLSTVVWFYRQENALACMSQS